MSAATFSISSIAQRAVAAQVEARYTLHGTNPTDGFASLTGESLLVFCQSRLRDLDTQINQRMTQQKTAMRCQSAVSDLKQAISGFASLGCNADGGLKKPDEVTGDDKAALARGNEAFDAAIHEAHEAGNEDLAASLQDLKAKWNNDGDARVSKDEMTGIHKALDNELANMSSNNEIQMIEMQSLISKRATALQLTTNMMNSMNESQKNITGNIGR